MAKIQGKYLPIGTVVILKDAKKRVMITGFCPMDNSDKEGRVYDYCGCVYPEGYLSFDKILLFNHDQIDKIFFMGLSEDEEEKEFKKVIKDMMINDKEKKENG